MNLLMEKAAGVKNGMPHWQKKIVIKKRRSKLRSSLSFIHMNTADYGAHINLHFKIIWLSFPDIDIRAIRQIRLIFMWMLFFFLQSRFSFSVRLFQFSECDSDGSGLKCIVRWSCIPFDFGCEYVYQPNRRSV